MSPADAQALRDALNSISLDAVRRVAYDETCEDLFFYIERLIRDACGDDIAGRLHTARSRNDIDMTMYRMRQREFIAQLAARDARAASCADRARASVIARRSSRAHTHTQPAQPSTIAHYLLAVIEQLQRDSERLRSAYDVTNHNPLGACAITGTGFPIDRQRTSELLGFCAPTGNTYGSIATVDYLLESVSATAILLVGLGRVRAGLPALVHDGVRLSAARRGLRAVEQHHAAEAQSGRARTCARDRQQGGRPGAGDHDRRPQHALRRHRRHRGRSAAAGGVDVPRRDAHRRAGRRRRCATRISTCSGWLRVPATAGRR